jgi:hypothetical protein
MREPPAFFIPNPDSIASGLGCAPEISVFLPVSSTYIIVGNPVTPEESGVASASTSAV